MSTITTPLPRDSAALRAGMSPADRLTLLRRVLAKAYEETESWRGDHLGTALAYLALAISDGKPDSFVDWTDGNGDESTRSARDLFRQWFPGEDPVWIFIVT